MRPGSAVVALAVASTLVAACGGDEPAADSGPAVTYVDDRGPGARTAPSERLPGGVYEDPIPDGNQAVQAEEVVRDYQESLATRSGTGACRELSEALARRLDRQGGCVAAVEDGYERQRAAGSPYRPSKILAVDLRGLERARVTVQDGEREPFVVLLRLDFAAQRWALTAVDLGDPSGLRPD